MKILIYGATGNIGSRIAREALQRGHDVTRVARHPARAQSGELAEVVEGDVLDRPSAESLARGKDAVVSAVGAGFSGPAPAFDVYRKAAESLVQALRSMGEGAPRLLAVGGAGTLEVAPGVRLVDTPQFPDMFKSEALGQAEALDFYRSVTDVRWTYVSPAMVIEPGERTGRYRTAGDQLLVDDQGNSKISMEDYAVAVVDELETPKAVGRRITVAY